MRADGWMCGRKRTREGDVGDGGTETETETEHGRASKKGSSISNRDGQRRCGTKHSIDQIWRILHTANCCLQPRVEHEDGEADNMHSNIYTECPPHLTPKLKVPCSAFRNNRPSRIHHVGILQFFIHSSPACSRTKTMYAKPTTTRPQPSPTPASSPPKIDNDFTCTEPHTPLTQLEVRPQSHPPPLPPQCLSSTSRTSARTFRMLPKLGSLQHQCPPRH